MEGEGRLGAGDFLCVAALDEVVEGCIETFAHHAAGDTRELH